MKRHIFLILILLLSWHERCDAQLNAKQLTRRVTLTVRVLLDLRLQILAAQMSSNSFFILDMGSVGFPVSIEINDSLKIVFEIRGSFESKLARDAQETVIQESMAVVDAGIYELFRRKFPQINFDRNKDLIGYWYFSESQEPSAKWQNGKFSWLK